MSHDQIEQQREHIELIRTAMNKRKTERARIEQVMEEYVSGLYQGFRQAVQELQEKGVPGIGTPRLLKHPAGDWRRVMQLLIDDWSIFIVPLLGAAWPNLRDEAQIPASSFKEVAGRIGFFLSLTAEPNPAQKAFYDIIVLLDSSWFAWGYGWPKQQAQTEGTDFAHLAVDLFASFVKDIHLTWSPRSETTFASAMDPKQRGYNFGLPGEE